MAAYVQDSYGAFHLPKFECDGAILFFRVCGARQNLYVFSLYRNPDLDDHILDCSLAAMAAVQAEDVRASFLFVGDLNEYHQKWLGFDDHEPSMSCCLFTSKLSLVAISWLPAQPVHVV